MFKKRHCLTQVGAVFLVSITLLQGAGFPRQQAKCKGVKPQLEEFLGALGG